MSCLRSPHGEASCTLLFPVHGRLIGSLVLRCPPSICRRKSRGFAKKTQHTVSTPFQLQIISTLKQPGTQDVQHTAKWKRVSHLPHKTGRISFPGGTSPHGCPHRSLFRQRPLVRDLGARQKVGAHNNCGWVGEWVRTVFWSCVVPALIKLTSSPESPLILPYGHHIIHGQIYSKM